jgi:long-chain acyl-CoA synthetase
VQAIYLCATPFSIANDLLTPTLKAKRPQLRKFFQTEIDEMYQSTQIAG